MNILLKGWRWNYLILQTLSSMSSFLWLTYPIAFPSFQNSVCPTPVCSVVRGSVSPMHCRGVSPFLGSCTATKRDHHANICLLPAFLSKDTVTTVSGSLQDRYPAASQQALTCALLSQPAAQTNCFPSSVMPGWNRGECEYSTYKPDTTVRKALDNTQLQNDHLAPMFARHRETHMEIGK